MLTYGAVLLHNKASPRTSTAARPALEHRWSISTGGSGLSPSDYHPFTYPKNWSGSQRFNNNEELMEGVKIWLRSPAENFFDISIQELTNRIPRYDKFFNSDGDYVEK
jgi:hypothetical protein